MYSRDPRFIRAKYRSFCAETKLPIDKGAMCLYFPLTRKVFRMNTEEVRKYREQLADYGQGFNY